MEINKSSMVKVEIDGIEFKVKKGSKIIEITDEVGIYIPRFCYHKKLSIAANCRMCLVEVEKAPKLFPACATPVMDNMKIFTNTKKVIDSQRSVMEFLLINHPLDCPICDQGGECELQDLTIGYGCTTSRYIESKRVVSDYNIGPLVSTDFTRCILCSRCVRFCGEIGGKYELGIINRGNSSRVFTFLKQHLTPGLSGNVIDLCPVGSLTSKPFKFKARPWELLQYSSISPHDCVGSNLYMHVYKGKIVRIVPRRNNFLNECWISDRDRFSYEGMYSNDRLKYPMIKIEGKWLEVSWEKALKFTAMNILKIREKFGKDNLGIIASPNSTLEEFYLLQKMCRLLGSNNLDHRLNQTDFSYQNKFPICPVINIDVYKQDLIFLIGSNIVSEQPILSLQIRKVSIKTNNIYLLNPVDYEFFMNIKEKYILNISKFIYVLSSILKTILNKMGNFSNFDISGINDVLANIDISNKYDDIVNKLINLENKLIIIGSMVYNCPDYYKIISLCTYISKITNTKICILTEGTNSAGAWLSGFIPHRLPGGKSLSMKTGLNIRDMLLKKLKCYIIFGTEIELDSLYGKIADNAFSSSEFVVNFSSYKSKKLLSNSNVLLPILNFYENSGTFINIKGLFQSFESNVDTFKNVKPGWSAIVDLSKHLNLSGFIFDNSLSVLEEVKTHINNDLNSKWNLITVNNYISNISEEIVVTPYLNEYNIDSLVRRSVSLQKVRNINNNKVFISCNEKLYNVIKSKEGDLCIINDNIVVKYLINIDNKISNNTLLIEYNSEEIYKNFIPYKSINVKNK